MPYPKLLYPEPLWQSTADPLPPQETLKYSSGSWCAQGMFEPSDCLWKVWGLILNVILPLIPCCWGFSFALGLRVSPQSHSSTYHLAGTSKNNGKFLKRWDYQTT